MPKHAVNRDRSRSRSRSRSKKSKKRQRHGNSPKRSDFEKEFLELKKRIKLLEEKTIVETEAPDDSPVNYSYMGTVTGESNIDNLSPPPQENDHEEVHSILEDPLQENCNNDIINLLGETVDSNLTVGAPLHKDIPPRWNLILKNGLNEEKLNEILLKYPPPDNFKELDTPKLNEEIKNAINPQVLKRDQKLGSIQHQVSASLTAIGHVISDLLKKEIL